MKNFVTSFLASLLALIVGGFVLMILVAFLFVGLTAGMMSQLGSKPSVAVTSGSVLRIDLNEMISDEPVADFMSIISSSSFKMIRQISLLDVISAIENAETDPNIEGIYLVPSPAMNLGMANMEEIRDALTAFKSTGKFIYSYADTYTQGSYYMASVADSVYLNPAGSVSWLGMSTDVMFFKGALNKLGVEPEVFRCGEFKSAVEPFIGHEMSPENRLQTEVLLGTIWGHVVGSVAASRSLDSAKLQDAASTIALRSADDALKHGFVDGLAYEDSVLSSIQNKTQKKSNFVDLADYALALNNLDNSDNHIAVVYAEGDIVDGLAEPGMVGSANLVKKLRKLRENDKVKGVVLRVNSPGGSALASDVIWREVSLLQQQKPVIVSMGNYAASGGYYIACPADAILAMPTTLTGSIGVFGLLFNAEKALEDKLGITIDGVKTNASAGMGSIFQPMNEGQRAAIQFSVNQTYAMFVEHVAQGRNMSIDSVKSVGGGRVWSGISASRNGLVDGLGGLKSAILLAAEKSGVADDFKIVTPSDEENPLQKMISMLLGQVASAKQGDLGRISREYDHLVRILQRGSGVQAVMPTLIKLN